jgi:cyclic lactone autoinducer peptide
LTKWKNLLGNLLGKCGSVLALAAVFVTANSACCWYYHQPEFPQEAKSLRKCKND